MSAREEVLRRVRAALHDVPPAEHPDMVPVTRDYRRAADVGDDPVALFAERVADYSATVEVVAADEVSTAVATMLRRRGVRRLAAPAGLPRAWVGAAADVVVDGAPHPLSVDELDAVDGAVTRCAVAVALTGTIVLDGGEGQGRRALSLVPDYHLCVVEADQVVMTVPEALARLDPTRPTTFVSGPSATSDIELDRVEGVHGPRTLDVVLLVSPGGPVRRLLDSARTSSAEEPFPIG